jgi:hypothetical protein
MNPGYEHITTAAQVEAYEASSGIFEGLLKEIRELSKKKSEATTSAGKVKIINRVLKDLLSFLRDEPEGKYLDELDDVALPQVSDVLLTMVQFETALDNFKSRYHRYVAGVGGHVWITKEYVASLEKRTNRKKT